MKTSYLYKSMLLINPCLELLLNPLGEHPHVQPIACNTHVREASSHEYYSIDSAQGHAVLVG